MKIAPFTIDVSSAAVAFYKPSSSATVFFNPNCASVCSTFSHRPLGILRGDDVVRVDDARSPARCPDIDAARVAIAVVGHRGFPADRKLDARALLDVLRFH